MAYGDFKDLTRRTNYDPILRDKVFNIAKNVKFNGYQRRLASMVYKSFNKKLLWVQSQRPQPCEINLQVALLKMRIFQTKNQLNNYTKQLLENFKNEKFTQFYSQYLGC